MTRAAGQRLTPQGTIMGSFRFMALALYTKRPPHYIVFSPQRHPFHLVPNRSRECDSGTVGLRPARRTFDIGSRHSRPRHCRELGSSIGVDNATTGAKLNELKTAFEEEGIVFRPLGRCYLSFATPASVAAKLQCSCLDEHAFLLLMASRTGGVR